MGPCMKPMGLKYEICAAQCYYASARGPPTCVDISPRVAARGQTHRCSGMKYLDTAEVTWWRHQLETFSALLALCVGNSPVAGEFPSQRPVTRGFVVCFDMRLNRGLSKQSWGWWFETPSRSLWRHCNVLWRSHSSLTENWVMIITMTSHERHVVRDSNSTICSTAWALKIRRGVPFEVRNGIKQDLNKIIDFTQIWRVATFLPPETSGNHINSSPPSAAYLRQWIGSALVQIMACHLFGAKPLSKPLLGYCQLYP